jgi:N utilization substance protein A
MSIHFAEAFNQLIRERRLDREVLMDTLTQGFASAVRRKHGPNAEVKIEDDGHGSIELFLVKHVVDAVEDDSVQISVAEAQDYAEGAEAGDVIEINVPFEEFGRNAIQITKQILMQKIREFERDRVFEEYKNRAGEIVSGSVQQIDRTGILVNLGNAEAFMPKKDQIRRERYQQGSSIRAVVMKVDKEAKGPMITLSRTSPEFLKALFVQEVPEIYEGMIEIKSIAREAGGRSKIAVYSRDDRVDAVGACVGMKGMRVQSIIRELRGEKIDIIEYHEDPVVFAEKALQPAKVSRVSVLDAMDKHLEVVVDDSQLSLAIGKKGQNVRLAAKLLGWKIDIKSEEEKRQEVEQQMSQLTSAAATPLEIVEGLGEGLVEKLKAAGVTTVEALADMTPEQLEAIEGIGPKTVEKISVAVNNYFASLEGIDAVELPENEGGEPAAEASAEAEPDSVEEIKADAEAEPEQQEAAPEQADEAPQGEGSEVIAEESTEPAEKKE